MPLFCASSLATSFNTSVDESKTLNDSFSIFILPTTTKFLSFAGFRQVTIMDHFADIVQVKIIGHFCRLLAC